MSHILFQLHRGITLSRLHLILVFLGGQEFIKNKFYVLFRKPVQGFRPMRYENKPVARICESYFTR